MFIGLENFQTRYLKSCHELGVELEGGRGRKRERERRGRRRVELLQCFIHIV